MKAYICKIAGINFKVLFNIIFISFIGLWSDFIFELEFMNFS